MITAIGDTCIIYVDAAHVLEPDDYVVTPTGRLYQVIFNRIQQRGKHKDRQHLTVRVLDPTTERDPDSHVLRLHWYARNRGARR